MRTFVGLTALLSLLPACRVRHEEPVTSAQLERDARGALRYIARHVSQADASSLGPVTEAPLLDTSTLAFETLARPDHESVHPRLAHTVELELTSENTGRIVWIERPGTPDEFRFTLVEHVRPFLAGEVANGLDDNGNGLIDERGFNCVIDRSAVTIRLSLERPGADGPETTTVETTVRFVPGA